MRHDTHTTQSRRDARAIAARVMIAVAGTAAVAACGSTAAPASSAPAKPKVSLNITVQDGVGGPVKHWTLQCDPTGGTHPDPAAACRALLAVKQPFAAPASGTMCPMILASAKRAIFNGSWFGQRVDRTITDGGCYLARWTKLGQVMN
jgi:Subtilisin inhibitor-like